MDPGRPMEEISDEDSTVIARIVQTIPAEHRAAGRVALEALVRALRQRGLDTDTLVQRTLTPQELTWRDQARALLGATDSSRKYVRVTVALVPQLSDSRAQAVIIRRPDDGGRPLVLLRESGAAPSDLAGGLKAAALAIRKFGEAPLAEQRLTIRASGSRAPAPKSGQAAALLEELKSSVPRAIPGVGSVRAMDILTPVARARS